MVKLTTVGLNELAKTLMGDYDLENPGSAHCIYYIAVGTGTSAEYASDTALGSEITTTGFARTATANSIGSGNNAIASCTLSNSSNDVELTEFGVFSKSGVLIARHVLNNSLMITATRNLTCEFQLTIST